MDSGQNDAHAVEALDGRRPVLGDPGHVDDVNLEPASIMLAAGQLARIKEFPTLLRAFRQVSRNRLVHSIIFGKGSWQQQLENVINQTGMEIKVSLPS